MRYVLFLVGLTVWAQNTPPPSSNAGTLRGKQPCSATVTDNCITTVTGGTVYGGGSGAGDVAGPAASVDSEIALFNAVSGKLIKRMTGTGLVLVTSGVASVDSGLQFNGTTKALGVFGPITSGQTSNYQGRIDLNGLTSGTWSLTADADGAGASTTGKITATGGFFGALTGNAATATALAANGANCSAGSYPLGVNASGAVEDCTAVGAGTGDVTGAANVTTPGLIVFAGADDGSVATDSGLAFNTTSKSVGIFGPIVSGQNSTYQGKLQLRGLTSGVSTLSADADGSGMSLDGNLTITGTLTAGASGASVLTEIAEPATPASGKVAYYATADGVVAAKDDAGNVSHTVRTKAAVSNQFVTAISDAGVVATAAIAAADLPAMVGDSGSGGTKGAVPAPSAGDAAKVLSGAGTWISAGGGATHVIFAASAVLATTNLYLSTGYTGNTVARGQFPIGVSGTATNLYCALAAAGSGGQTTAFTVYHGAGLGSTASATSTTCTTAANGTTCSDTAHSFSVTAGDMLTVLALESSTTNTTYAYCALTITGAN